MKLIRYMMEKHEMKRDNDYMRELILNSEADDTYQILAIRGLEGSSKKLLHHVDLLCDAGKDQPGNPFQACGGDWSSGEGLETMRTFPTLNSFTPCGMAIVNCPSPIFFLELQQNIL